MRKRLIIAVTFLGGIYFIVEFLLPERFPSGFGQDGAWRGIRIREYHEEILTGIQSVGMAAIGLGLINIFRVFGMNVVKKRKDWIFSLTLILAMLTMITITFWTWSQDLSLQHEVGPLSIQRDFQTSILNYCGQPPPASQQADEQRQRLRDAALSRYLTDTRKSVAPPAVSTSDAASQLSALASFLKGAAPAPSFWQVDDAPENPPEYSAPNDLLAQSKELQPLKTSGADAELIALVKQRDSLTDALMKASNALKAQNNLNVQAIVASQAIVCRDISPALEKLSVAIRHLADAERKVYLDPPDYALRYKGGRAPAPAPMFGRLYLAARAMRQSACALDKYAKVLDQAAVEIPATKTNQQTLTNWLIARVKNYKALRAEWQQRANADITQALPTITTKLARIVAAPDALRQQMLDDLRRMENFLATTDQALNELESVDVALIGTGSATENNQIAIEAAKRSLAIIRAQENDWRQLRTRIAEQDIHYLDLTSEDAQRIILPALSEQTAATSEAGARASDVLKSVVAAITDVETALNRQCQNLQTQLDTSIQGLLKTWRETSSLELQKQRERQNAFKRDIAEMQTRIVVVAEARKIVSDAAAKVTTLPEIQALTELLAQLPRSKSISETTAVVSQARKALTDGGIFVLQSANKILERFAYKHDMKDLRALLSAMDSIRALIGAMQSSALLDVASKSSARAVNALDEADLPSARLAMARVAQEIAQSQESAKDVLQERVNRSIVKGLYKCLFDGLYISLGAAMFSLLAFYIASAAYRAFRVKSAEALLMMIAALLVMLGQIPFGSYIWTRFSEARLWVLQVFSAPAFRGIALGAAVAFLAMAMRMWLSLEIGAFYREETASGEEGA